MPCHKAKQTKSIKQWGYGKTKVSRFKCKCGKLFNFYQGKKSTWTIPKGTEIRMGKNASIRFSGNARIEQN